MVTIRITPDEMLESMRMLDDTVKETEIWEHLEKNGFLFNEFRLCIKGRLFRHKEEANLVYKIEIDGYGDNQAIYIRKIMNHQSGKRDISEFVITINEFLNNVLKMLQDNINKQIYEMEIDEEVVELLVPMFFMHYCIDKAMNQQYEYKEITNKKYKPMNERSKSKPKTEYKLFEIIRKYERHINKNRHNMTCEHWEVKGHFRHYKSGKVVYIKPFSKGKNKEAKIENRTYRL